MAKYNERLTAKIARLIEEDIYTIGEICDALKISRFTFYEWKNTKPEFREAIEFAEDRRDDALAALARKSLKDKIEGCIITTEKITYIDDGYGEQIMKSKVVTHRKCQPDVRAIKLALERQDRKREKEESKNNEPQKQPLILKFPKSVDPIKTEANVRGLLDKLNNKENYKTTDMQKEDNDDKMYHTVRIN